MIPLCYEHGFPLRLVMPLRSMLFSLFCTALGYPRVCRCAHACEARGARRVSLRPAGGGGRQSARRHKPPMTGRGLSGTSAILSWLEAGGNGREPRRFGWGWNVERFSGATHGGATRKVVTIFARGLLLSCF